MGVAIRVQLIRHTVLLIAALAATPAWAAAQMTVGDLQQICSGRDAETKNACRFFILGVVEGATLATGRTTAAGPLCIADNVGDAELVSAVKKIMDGVLVIHPEDKSLAAAGFVVAAAMKAYPCGK